jgi:N4-gp56 family major capsid protein
MAINTVANWKPAVREYYDRVLLMTAYPNLIHGTFAQKRILPKKMGDTIVFRRYNTLSTVPVPLQDGITPPGATMSYNDIKASVDYYGNYVTFTDQVSDTIEDETLNVSTKMLAQNFGQTIDEISRDVLVSTSSVYQCSNGLNGNTPTEITNDDLFGAVQAILNNDGKMISEVILGSTKVATSPVRPAFWGFIDTALLDDLEAVSTFNNVANYSGNQKVLDNEWGSTRNIRWLYTSIGKVSTAGTPVYSLPIVGKEAYAAVQLGNMTGEFYVEQLGSAGTADPLHQRGSVSWKHPFVCRILNDNFMECVLATHS